MVKFLREKLLKEMGLKYKIHLLKEGKSEEQIASLLTEWKLNQEENRTRHLEKKEAKKKAVRRKARMARIEALRNNPRAARRRRRRRPTNNRQSRS